MKTLVTVTLLLALGHGAAGVAIQAPTLATPDATPFLSLGISALATGERSGSATSSFDLESPESNYAAVAGGFAAQPPRDPCGFASGSSVASAAAQIAWRLKGQLVSKDAAGVLARLTLERIVNDAQLNVAPFSQTFQIYLRERQNEVLDLIRFSPELGLSCDGIVVNTWMSYGHELEHDVLEYRLWLVHRSPDGTERFARAEAKGLQGREMPYAFSPLRFTSGGKPQDTGPIAVQLKGDVKGRLRRDGRVDLVIDMDRMVWAGGGGAGDGGQKQATVSLGETIEFELPPTLGNIRSDMGDLSSVFSGHHTAIRIQVSRAS